MPDRPKLCANCNKLIGLESVCPYCGANNSGVGLRLKRALGTSQGDDGQPRLTWIFIATNIFFFALAAVQGLNPAGGGFELLSPDGAVLFQLGIQSNPAVAAGDWWRLVTAVFLHLGILHLLFNCYVLYVTGPVIEEEFGPRLMFLVYMMAGVLGFVASYFANIGGAGASGAISGLMGAALVRRRLVDGDFSHPISRYVIQLIVITVVFSLVVDNVNHVAHGVGFVVGAGFAALLTEVKLGRVGAIALALLTVLSVLGTLAAFVSLGIALAGGGPTEFGEAQTCWTSSVREVVERPVPSTDIQPARVCLANMPSLEGAADEVRDRATHALNALARAREATDEAEARAAHQAIKKAFIDYIRWRDKAAPRFGYGPSFQ